MADQLSEIEKRGFIGSRFSDGLELPSDKIYTNEYDLGLITPHPIRMTNPPLILPNLSKGKTEKLEFDEPFANRPPPEPRLTFLATQANFGYRRAEIDAIIARQQDDDKLIGPPSRCKK